MWRLRHNTLGSPHVAACDLQSATARPAHIKSMLLLTALVLSQLEAATARCWQHRTISECIVFRNQHNCVWNSLVGRCVADKPCDRRTRRQCETELTTGERWDDTRNKCVER